MTFTSRIAILRGAQLAAIFLVSLPTCRGDDGYRLWLKYDRVAAAVNIQGVLAESSSPTIDKAQAELVRGLSGLLGHAVLRVKALDRDGIVVLKKGPFGLKKGGYQIRFRTYTGHRMFLISADEDVGILYGAFHFLRLVQTGQSLDSFDLRDEPRIDIRMLDHWDNLDGSNERGYAGKPLWKWDQLPETLDPRYEDYARADASIGINAAVLNNVNSDSRILRADYLKKVARLADVFRPYGITVYLAVSFASPLKPPGPEQKRKRSGGIGTLDTADPLNPEVRQWWKSKAKEIYALIPDFGGFLVKANSEGMPGPQEYHRTHADGANMLAEALKPYGGRVLWRAFVYGSKVDPDRAKDANIEFARLDGQFADNAFIQIKNGPIDFQPREPLSPLFVNLKKTRMVLELQITQEYLGHASDLVYLGTQFKEYLGFDFGCPGPGTTVAAIIEGKVWGLRPSIIAGVANTGSDRNWTGHEFAQANWFAFGRLAWDPGLSPESIADDWIRMTLSHDEPVVGTIKSMMMGSWEAAVNYQEPLGLLHLMRASDHYGPAPASRVNKYFFMDAEGIGYERSTGGSDMVSQYCSPLSDEYDSLQAYPEKYLLFFHKIPWDFRMASGRTLWDELCWRYDSGVGYVRQMRKQWDSLKGRIDPDIQVQVSEKLEAQEAHAKDWRNTCLGFFATASRRPIP